MVLQEKVILPDLKDIPHATALLTVLLFALNIDYSKELSYTFEVIQKVLMNVGAGQSSSLVHSLGNKLLQKTFEGCVQTYHLVLECLKLHILKFSVEVHALKFKLCTIYANAHICILYVSK